MTNRQIPTVCRFCSRVSALNGELPIGSAGTYDQYLMIEVPLPWPEHLWQDAGLLSRDLLDRLAECNAQGKIRPLLIAPDPGYSRPDLVRLLHFYRPAVSFARFAKRDYLVPARELAGLVEALVAAPDRLPGYERYRQQSDRLRELFICTHGRVDAACGKFGFPIYRHLRERYGTNGSLRVWRSSHFGGHEYAPTLLDLPYGHYWGQLHSGMLDALVRRAGPFDGLARYYRGWGGVGYFAQLAEREILRREGWEWIDYRKAATLLALYEAGSNHLLEPGGDTYTRYHLVTRGDPHPVGRAELRIDYRSPDGTVRGAYEATVERHDEALKQWHSTDRTLSPIHTYRVVRLVQVGDSRPDPAVAGVA